jgi:hypothetical protein
MDLLVQWFYQLLETEKVARLSVHTINAKSSQPNKSLKLTVAARVCLTCGLRQLVFRLINSWKQCLK